MNDKDRDLVEQVLNAAGTAGVKGFEFMVKYEFASGITNMLGWGTSLLFVAYLLKRLFAWTPKDSYDGGAQMLRGAGIVVTCLFAIACLSGIFDGVLQLIAPEGAAIARALKH